MENGFNLELRAFMPNRDDIKPSEAKSLSAGVIQVAFEKLFGGGRGVQTFGRSGLRYVKLPGGAILIEQNPKKKSKWAQLTSNGHNVAWALRDGKYLARVIDGEVNWLSADYTDFTD